MQIVGGTQINITQINSTTGQPQQTLFDLSQVGDVFGGFSCASGSNCQIKTTQMSSSGGFYGKYGAPSSVQNAALKRRLRMLGNEDFDYREL